MRMVASLLVASALLTVGVPASAPHRRHAPAPAPIVAAPTTAPTTERLYDRSGTLGREGLGADPFHPEGPGNQSLSGNGN